MLMRHPFGTPLRASRSVFLAAAAFSLRKRCQDRDLPCRRCLRRGRAACSGPRCLLGSALPARVRAACSGPRCLRGARAASGRARRAGVSPRTRRRARGAPRSVVAAGSVDVGRRTRRDELVAVRLARVVLRVREALLGAGRAAEHVAPQLRHLAVGDREAAMLGSVPLMDRRIRHARHPTSGRGRRVIVVNTYFSEPACDLGVTRAARRRTGASPTLRGYAVSSRRGKLPAWRPRG